VKVLTVKFRLLFTLKREFQLHIWLKIN